MIPLFTKAISAVDANDVARLWEDSIQEGQTVEFKEFLPAKRGRESWHNGAGELGEYARDKILSSVVAFANSNGGNLIVGVAETDETPSRAKGPALVPRCHELADRLARAARDCIEPPLQAIEIEGVSASEGSDDGFILLRVQPSHLSPHRLKTTRHCYMRRREETVAMTMWEIQNRSIDLIRGIDALDEELRRRRERFRLSAAPKGISKLLLPDVGIRATVLPANGKVLVDQIYRMPAMRELLLVLPAQLPLGPTDIDTSIVASMRDRRLEPFFRGATRSRVFGGQRVCQEILRNGLVEFTYRCVQEEQDQRPIYIEWVLALAANAIYLARKVLEANGSPSVELALEVEAHCVHNGHPTGKVAISSSIFHQLDSVWNNGKEIAENPLITEVLSVPPGNASDALRSVLNDFLNATGEEGLDNFVVAEDVFES